ncbi:MAG: hypothetical protein ACKVW3_07875 [Phycisphaerales bacterium]
MVARLPSYAFAIVSATALFVAGGCAATGPKSAATASGADAPATAAASRSVAFSPATPDELLRAMERAVLAADIEGYLRLIDRTDPVFAKEQENWAADLARKKPAEFLLVPSDEFDGDASGRRLASLTFRWRMPSASAGRQVSFPATLRNTPVGWRYAGETWLVHEAERVRVMYIDEGASKLAERAAAVLAEVRPSVDEGFGLADDAAFTSRTQEIKLYSSMRHLQHSIYLSYTDGLGGWNEPGESIKILARNSSRAGELRVLLAHEYGHCATFELGPAASGMPWWALEGVAEMSAEKYTRGWPRTDRTVRAWAASEGLVEWEKLADFHNGATAYSHYVYTQGHHMTGWISRKWDRPTLNRWLRAMAAGQSLDAATIGVLGVAFSELDTQWREELRGPAVSDAP